MEHVAIAARFVRHKQAYDSLKALVQSGHTAEHKFQDFLAENPWTFGSEEKLGNRVNNTIIYATTGSIEPILSILKT